MPAIADVKHQIQRVFEDSVPQQELVWKNLTTLYVNNLNMNQLCNYYLSINNNFLSSSASLSTNSNSSSSLSNSSSSSHATPNSLYHLTNKPNIIYGKGSFLHYLIMFNEDSQQLSFYDTTFCYIPIIKYKIESYGKSLRQFDDNIQDIPISIQDYETVSFFCNGLSQSSCCQYLGGIFTAKTCYLYINSRKKYVHDSRGFFYLWDIIKGKIIMKLSFCAPFDSITSQTLDGITYFFLTFSTSSTIYIINSKTKSITEITLLNKTLSSPSSINTSSSTSSSLKFDYNIKYYEPKLSNFSYQNVESLSKIDEEINLENPYNNSFYLPHSYLSPTFSPSTAHINRNEFFPLSTSYEDNQYKKNYFREITVKIIKNNCNENEFFINFITQHTYTIEVNKIKEENTTLIKEEVEDVENNNIEKEIINTNTINNISQEEKKTLTVLHTLRLNKNLILNSSKKFLLSNKMSSSLITIKESSKQDYLLLFFEDNSLILYKFNDNLVPIVVSELNNLPELLSISSLSFLWNNFERKNFSVNNKMDENNLENKEEIILSNSSSHSDELILASVSLSHPSSFSTRQGFSSQQYGLLVWDFENSSWRIHSTVLPIIKLIVQDPIKNFSSFFPSFSFNVPSQILGMSSNNSMKLWKCCNLFYSDFAGPLYPVGYRVISRVISYIEAEDELDIIEEIKDEEKEKEEKEIYLNRKLKLDKEKMKTLNIKNKYESIISSKKISLDMISNFYKNNKNYDYLKDNNIETKIEDEMDLDKNEDKIENNIEEDKNDKVEEMKINEEKIDEIEERNEEDNNKQESLLDSVLKFKEIKFDKDEYENEEKTTDTATLSNTSSHLYTVESSTLSPSSSFHLYLPFDYEGLYNLKKQFFSNRQKYVSKRKYDDSTKKSKKLSSSEISDEIVDESLDENSNISTINKEKDDEDKDKKRLRTIVEENEEESKLNREDDNLENHEDEEEDENELENNNQNIFYDLFVNTLPKKTESLISGDYLLKFNNKLLEARNNYELFFSSTASSSSSSSSSSSGPSNLTSSANPTNSSTSTISFIPSVSLTPIPFSSTTTSIPFNPSLFPSQFVQNSFYSICRDSFNITLRENFIREKRRVQYLKKKWNGKFREIEIKKKTLLEEIKVLEEQKEKDKKNKLKKKENINTNSSNSNNSSEIKEENKEHLLSSPMVDPLDDSVSLVLHDSYAPEQFEMET